MNVVVFDIEATDLAASWGRMLCCSFAPLGGETYTFRADRAKWKGKNAVDDSRLAVAIRDELEKYDIVVGWNSKLYDVPMINARLALAGEREVRIGSKYASHHWDAMWTAGGSTLRIGGKRLETVSKYFGTNSSKTPLTGQTWQLAAAGDKKAMDEVVEHCEADVEVLRDLWPHLAPLSKQMTFNMSEVWQFIDQIPSRKL